MSIPNSLDTHNFTQRRGNTDYQTKVVKEIMGNNERTIRLCPDFDTKDEKSHEKGLNLKFIYYLLF